MAHLYFSSPLFLSPSPPISSIPGHLQLLDPPFEQSKYALQYNEVSSKDRKLWQLHWWDESRVAYHIWGQEGYYSDQEHQQSRWSDRRRQLAEGDEVAGVSRIRE